ncbi:MAG TPA: glycerol kinase GlpK [Anaerolineae bacterium]|nr:glycerol kinase GlpK [Anaerolineae bacterium]
MVSTPRGILAIDQGTTNTKVVLVDSSGQVYARASRPLQVYYPQPAWVQQDPQEIWRSVIGAITDCTASVESPDIIAVAITNQRESVVAWERATGLPVGPVITWQCRRTAPFCDDLKTRGLEEFLHERTGLTIDPLFSASKARWLIDHIPDGVRRAADGEICIGTMDSWVLWNLTGGSVHACDVSNASRTQLLNLAAAQWDDELLDLFGIPRVAMPQVKSSSCVYGETKPFEGLRGGIPIASLIGDSHAALYGHAGIFQGAVKATYGTGSSLMTPLSAPVSSTHGLSTTIAWGREKITYALEGNISATGAAVQWLGQVLGWQDNGREIEAMSREVKDAGGVYLVPAFVGLGAPYWNPDARGTITGLTRGTTRAHLARATLESIAYQIRDVFDALEADTHSRLQKIYADGGASRNDLLMQFQADILDRPVLRNRSSDVSALGAAYLAGLAIGVWKSEEEIAHLARPADLFEPHMPESERAARYDGWKRAVAQTMFHA